MKFLNMKFVVWELNIGYFLFEYSVTLFSVFKMNQIPYDENIILFFTHIFTTIIEV